MHTLEAVDAVAIEAQPSSFVGWLFALADTYALRDKLNQCLVVVAHVVGLVVILLVAIDAISNNWAVIDYVGNGNEFIAPVANVGDAPDLVNAYTFLPGRDLQSLSSVGLWMANYTVSNLGRLGSNIYVLSADTYALDHSNDLCSRFSGIYPMDLGRTNNVVKLGITYDLITYLRGNAVTIASTDEASANLGNASMGSGMLHHLGYAAARIAADLRLTRAIRLQNTSSLQVQAVSFWRLYTKGYCTGCIPIAELGYGSCNFSMTYTDANKTLHHKTAILVCKARRLSTLQWFFMTHMFTFGLPEKELRAKAKYQPTTQGTTPAGETGPGHETCMVVQDSNCHIHLLDDQLADVKSLVYNIKVLKDTTVVINMRYSHGNKTLRVQTSPLANTQYRMALMIQRNAVR
ncbi:hypothetical protein SDRG_03792 [Saprolegnia diclina VS20]|uniref:Uncharacterized protein n=1 Tax=Saprolegnia diclina (strain VS20) TaxID=1156394 RepID=T0QL80_SAPDV|nr:hypothetical protein SDRG_03792 [Saprolegnia diclina VS20]EQC38834.1 hypothetical protein SDRG_03792 [Saprolegnia diclina VS20]|eukprot:XP_008607658.1 hypothetical protein SDRG_03792 [Saprolegnia diclina VS20]